MKLNIDLSNTEMSNLLQGFKDDARMIAELTNQVAQTRNELWKAQAEKRDAEAGKGIAVRDAEYWKSEYNYQRETINRLQETIRTLQTDLDARKVDGNLGIFLKMLEAAHLTREGKKINAIKVVRGDFRIGLKEAKDLVEKAAETYQTAASKENLASLEAAHASPVAQEHGAVLGCR